MTARRGTWGYSKPPTRNMFGQKSLHLRVALVIHGIRTRGIPIRSFDDIHHAHIYIYIYIFVHIICTAYCHWVGRWAFNISLQVPWLVGGWQAPRSFLLKLDPRKQAGQTFLFIWKSGSCGGDFVVKGLPWCKKVNSGCQLKWLSALGWALVLPALVLHMAPLSFRR